MVVRFYSRGLNHSPAAEVTLINQGRCLDCNSMKLFFNLKFSKLDSGGYSLTFKVPLDMEFSTSGVTAQEFHLATDLRYFDAWLSLTFLDASGQPKSILSSSVTGPFVPTSVRLELQSVWLQQLNIVGNVSVSPEDIDAPVDEQSSTAWQRYFPTHPWAVGLAVLGYILLGGISIKALSENMNASPYWTKVGLMPAAIASINLIHFYYLLLYILAAYVGLRFWAIFILALLSQLIASGTVLFIILGILQRHTDLQQVPKTSKIGLCFYGGFMFFTVLFVRQIANSGTLHACYLLLIQTGAPVTLIRYLVNKKHDIAQPVNYIPEFRWEYNFCYFGLIGSVAMLLRGYENDFFLLSHRSWAGALIILMNLVPFVVMFFMVKVNGRLSQLLRRTAPPNPSVLHPTATHQPFEVELMELPRNMNDGDGNVPGR